MLVMKLNDGSMIIKKENEIDKPFYRIAIGANGKPYVKRESVPCIFNNISEGNDKTGEKVYNYNFPIEYTCNHNCECYADGLCYALNGCYQFGDNQLKYAENFNFFLASNIDEFCKSIQIAIDATKYSLFRWFTCGDIPNRKFFDCMIKLANDNPDITFWSYTKKYGIVNHWIDENGLEAMPHNLTIIFSHWLNKDGTYFPMNNPYNLPTSEFIPFGKEELAEKVTHICPCSNPDVVANCANCEHPCHSLKFGESMALKEHSTKETKKRDKALRESKKAIKEKEKAEKKAAKEAEKASRKATKGKGRK